MSLYEIIWQSSIYTWHDRFGQLGLMRRDFHLEKMCGSSPTDAAQAIVPEWSKGSGSNPIG